jgi:hypothetical protein
LVNSFTNQWHQNNLKQHDISSNTEPEASEAIRGCHLQKLEYENIQQRISSGTMLGTNLNTIAKSKNRSPVWWLKPVSQATWEVEAKGL